MKYTVHMTILTFQVRIMSKIIIYTDGSSDYKQKTVGCGAILIDNDEIISKISRNVTNEKLHKFNNVAGEILAVCFALEEAIKIGYEMAIVHVDYIGLINWYNGTWMARNWLSKLYIERIREYSKHIQIEFVKVKAHSDNKYNDIVDILAKKAIGKG